MKTKEGETICIAVGLTKQVAMEERKKQLHLKIKPIHSYPLGCFVILINRMTYIYINIYIPSRLELLSMQIFMSLCVLRYGCDPES